LPFDAIKAADKIRCEGCECTFQYLPDNPKISFPAAEEGTIEELDELCRTECSNWIHTDPLFTQGELRLWKADKCTTLAPPPPAAETTKTKETGKVEVPKLDNPLGTTSIPELIGKVIKAILGIVGSIAFLMFIWGGFLWMTAAGESKKVEKGKETLVWATIGLATIFFAYAATSFVIKSLTGGVGGAETEQTSQAVEGFCICREGEAMVLPLKEIDVSQSDCQDAELQEAHEYYNCTWRYGGCKNGAGEFSPTITRKENCTGSGLTWVGEE